MLAALVAICAVAAIGTYLTAPRPGGQMDPDSTGPDGAHALVALLRDRGVTVVVANSVDEAVNAARPGTLLLFAQTQRVTTEPLTETAGRRFGDLLLVEPTSHARAALAPGIRSSGAEPFSDPRPDCALREANQAGTVDFGPSNTFRAVGDEAVTSCYGGALVRYRDGDRSCDVVGSTDFMTNGSLLRAGNAALAMNLAGQHPRLVWYAPQHIEGGSSAKGMIFDLIPEQRDLDGRAAVADGGARRVMEGPTDRAAGRRGSARGGPRVGDGRRPRSAVPVAASPRSRRAGTAHRNTTAHAAPTRPRPGCPATSGGASRSRSASRSDPESLRHILFGPPPATDADLIQLTRALDDIERQVTQS